MKILTNVQYILDVLPIKANIIINIQKYILGKTALSLNYATKNKPQDVVN